MTTNRRRVDAGWQNPKRLARGPTGRPCCRYCGREVPKGRRTFCGEPCVHEWRIRTDPQYVRQQVWQRDHGVCAVCGRDMDAAAREFYQLPGWYRVQLDALFLPPSLRGRSQWWDAHHVLAVAEGGGECGLDGYQTLCYRCHAAETAALRGRLAGSRQARRPQAAQAEQLTLEVG